MAEQLTLEQVNLIRARVLNGEDVPIHELQACIEFLRISRAAAPKVKEAKAKAMKPGTLTAEKKQELLSALEDL